MACCSTDNDHFEKFANQCLYISLDYTQMVCDDIDLRCLLQTYEQYRLEGNATRTRCMEILTEQCDNLRREDSHKKFQSKFQRTIQLFDGAEDKGEIMTAFKEELINAVLTDEETEHKWRRVLLSIMMTKEIILHFLTNYTASNQMANEVSAAIIQGLKKALTADKESIETLNGWHCFIQKNSSLRAPKKRLDLPLHVETGLIFAAEGREYALRVLEKGFGRDFSVFSEVDPNIRSTMMNRFLTIDCCASDVEDTMGGTQSEDMLGDMISCYKQYLSNSGECEFKSCFLSILMTDMFTEESLLQFGMKAVLRMYVLLRRFSKVVKTLQLPDVDNNIVKMILEIVYKALGNEIFDIALDNQWSVFFEEHGYRFSVAFPFLGELREQLYLLMEKVTNRDLSGSYDALLDDRESFEVRTYLVTQLAEDQCENRLYSDELVERIYERYDYPVDSPVSFHSVLREVVRFEFFTQERLATHGWECFVGLFILVSRLAMKLRNYREENLIRDLNKIGKTVTSVLRDVAENFEFLGDWWDFEEVYKYLLDSRCE